MSILLLRHSLYLYYNEFALFWQDVFCFYLLIFLKMLKYKYSDNNLRRFRMKNKYLEKLEYTKVLEMLSLFAKTYIGINKCKNLISLFTILGFMIMMMLDVAFG